MQRIELPERTYANFGHPLNELIRLAGAMAKAENGCYLDLTQSKFLSPFLLGGAAALLKEQQERGLPSGGGNNRLDGSLKAYLELVRFPDGLSQAGDDYAAKRLLADLRSKTYIPIVSFAASLVGEDEREALIQAMESLLVQQCGLQGTMLSVLKYLIAELTGNIAQHAAVGTGFLFAQYMPNGRYMDVVIADTGQGLLQSYLRHGKFKPISDAEALHLALNGRSTKDIPESRGFGIPTSRNMLVNGLGGSFFYWSGTAFLFNTSTVNNIYELRNGTTFPGCYLALRIPTMAPSTFNLYNFVG